MKSRLVMFLAVALAGVAVGFAAQPPGPVRPQSPAARRTPPWPPN